MQPQLPTDNLYKFMALSGVAIVISGGLLLIQAKDKLAQSKIDEQATLKKLELSTELLKVRSELFVSYADNEKEDKSTNSDALYILEKTNEVTADLNKSQAKTVSAKKEVDWATKVYLLTSVLGALIGWKGFDLWYQRVQKYEDMILSARAKAIQK